MRIAQVAPLYERVPPALYGGTERVVSYLTEEEVDAVDRAYFDRTIRPLLDGPGVDFLGEVDDACKAALLAGAHALLFPVDWPEPFGLVMIEALACGTPVIARRRGSVPEIIRDGVTGWLCDADDEMVAAVGRVAELSRARCREEFERRYTAAAMALRYLAVYERVRATAPSPRRSKAVPSDAAA